jgi:hypothetical protein
MEPCHRHAEKHQHASHDRGVTEDGRPPHRELTVRGWQRAGALATSLYTHVATEILRQVIGPPESSQTPAP